MLELLALNLIGGATRVAHTRCEAPTLLPKPMIFSLAPVAPTI